ncbi:GH36-type glycosyl hydrolase domain-containing protein [Humibacillus xanthopallidus]|uniref:GH36-type glycosyl hydrolase domain-containing protein n=1 Tax=Humibacillus xanthopallidus TaxID=412689 RepID=UPI0038500ECF
MLDEDAVLTALSHQVLTSPSGVTAEVLHHGALHRLEAHGLSLLLQPATVAEAGLTNVHLRVHGPDGLSRRPLLGPGSGSTVRLGDREVIVEGTHADVDYRLALRLGSEQATWHWLLEVTNTRATAVTVDAVLTHDPALAPMGAVRTNEYYVSQYLDLSPVQTAEQGVAVAVRQNMPGERAPWLMVGTLGHGESWATDALQLVERTPEGVVWRGLDAPSLPSRRLQHEHSLIAVQDQPTELAPGQTHLTGFWGIALPDHPEATSDADARWAEVALHDAPSTREDEPVVVGTDAGTLWSSAPAHAATPLDHDALDRPGLLTERTHVETDADGNEIAWTVRGGQLVTAAKDLVVLRPHGHILRTGDTLTPDSRGLTSTVWMAGTFHSQITRGHVGRDPVATGRRTYLGLQRAHGVRAFVDDGSGGWQLLETPSAWFVGLDHCTWWYAAASGDTVEVTSSAPADDDALGLRITQSGGPARRILLAWQVADDLSDPPTVTVTGSGAHLRSAGAPHAWDLTWSAPGDAEVGDARLQADGTLRGPGWLTVLFDPVDTIALTLVAGPPEPAGLEVHSPTPGLGQAFWSRTAEAVSLTSTTDEHRSRAEQLSAALPFFVHNALIHYLSPRGLEQFSGGAWGTRDISQGPVGLLTALGDQDSVRDVLLRLFRAQNARGDWPQAFDFLPPLPSSGQQDSHGDVVFWPVLAAGDYLRTTGDVSLLDERLPFVGDDGLTGDASVTEHLRRAIARITECTVPGSPLPAYGHGDWNDSLQPADPALAARLVSTWTAVLQTQALRTLAEGLRATGAPGAEATDLAAEADALATRTHEAISARLELDPVLPGYLLHHDDGTVEPLVHPSDERTGLHYGVLPWIHAISADLLTPEQARHHLDLIEEHLLGPDGARLFDRPVGYVGGPMAIFQRAEASTFWGREIGLMYVHAHLRYAEALARVGDGDALLTALAKASPVGIETLVPQARPRQTSCYYSSSDGAFTDRYEAQERYPALLAGDVPLEGGWRVYSSGPGLVLRLVTEVLLGFRTRGERIEVDPVLPPGSELVAHLPVGGRPAVVRFTAGPLGHGVRRISVAGRDLELEPLTNPYREPGVAVAAAALVGGPAAPADPEHLVEIVVETH